MIFLRSEKKNSYFRFGKEMRLFNFSEFVLRKLKLILDEFSKICYSKGIIVNHKEEFVM